MHRSRYDIGWTRERGVAFKLPETELMHVLIAAAIVGVSGSFVYTMIPFFHMFYALGRDTSKSEQTKILIRQSLRRLLVQLNVPFLFVTVPLIVICTQAGHRCFPFSEQAFVLTQGSGKNVRT
ncbi:hypothetical protein PRIPAC_78790 [Pristionchus pacificus]|uniref:G protein-coupled receptor n=1 Tax=Pristionchus pacificus TaxID=54126 RepID=A0A2A6CJG7_PRIPA|nr:hypothetical protein PRIPAC_78790 [Pristionchus pacificus]|eukprot:PDM78161.1 G protein-coupled receptor [Pristionchus pacificus]